MLLKKSIANTSNDAEKRRTILLLIVPLVWRKLIVNSDNNVENSLIYVPSYY